jgi:hypothetical protein
VPSRLVFTVATETHDEIAPIPSVFCQEQTSGASRDYFTSSNAYLGGPECEANLDKFCRWKQICRCPSWVISGNAHKEPMTSAFHPIATEQRTQFYVGFVPDSDIHWTRLFDHLVGAGEQRGRHVQADRVRCL